MRGKELAYLLSAQNTDVQVMKKHQLHDRAYEQVARCIVQGLPFFDNSKPSERNRALVEVHDLSDTFGQEI